MQDQNPTDRFLPWKELKSIIPYSRVHVGRLEERGLFPKRTHLGAGRVAWLASEINTWIDEKIAQRDASCVVDQDEEKPAEQVAGQSNNAGKAHHDR